MSLLTAATCYILLHFLGFVNTYFGLF